MRPEEHEARPENHTFIPEKHESRLDIVKEYQMGQEATKYKKRKPHVTETRMYFSKKAPDKTGRDHIRSEKYGYAK